MAIPNPEKITATVAGPSFRASLLASAAVSLITLLIAAFEPSMADWPSSLVLLAILPLAALLFFGCWLWSATLLVRVRSDGVKFAVPFMICALTLVTLVYAPLQQIWLQRNFYWHRADRERIVARVEAGDLKPNVTHDSSLIALGDDEPKVSAGGNDIVVDRSDDGFYVLFLTSRGLKHTFTGFLHVPPGGDPKDFFEFDDKPPSQIVQYDKDWYFVAN
jgi:hypothetical protein